MILRKLVRFFVHLVTFPKPKFKKGKQVKVHRTSGKMETDWFIQSIISKKKAQMLINKNLDGICYLVAKNGRKPTVMKLVPEEKLLEWNPPQDKGSSRKKSLKHHGVRVIPREVPNKMEYCSQ